MAHLSQVLSELDSASKKLQNISDEIADMIIINDSRFATQDMNYKVKNIMIEIRKAADAIKENRDMIESCCDALGLSVVPTGGGASSGNIGMGGGANRSQVSYSCVQ